MIRRIGYEVMKSGESSHISKDELGSDFEKIYKIICNEAYKKGRELNCNFVVARVNNSDPRGPGIRIWRK